MKEWNEKLGREVELCTEALIEAAADVAGFLYVGDYADFRADNVGRLHDVDGVAEHPDGRTFKTYHELAEALDLDVLDFTADKCIEVEFDGPGHYWLTRNDRQGSMDLGVCRDKAELDAALADVLEQGWNTPAFTELEIED